MIQLRDYTVAVENATQGQSAVYRHPKSKDGFLPNINPNLDSVQALFVQSFSQFKDKLSFGTYNPTTDKYDQITFGEIESLSKKLGSAILKLNIVQPVTDTQGITINPVGIYMKNRREWQMIDIACVLCGLTSAPFYDTLGTEGIQHAIDKTKVQICFCQASTAEALSKSQNQTLKVVVGIEPLSEQAQENFKARNITVYSLEDFLKLGEEIVPIPQIDKKVSWTIVFTSGSTGLPKAAVISQSALASMVALFGHDQDFMIKHEDVYLSYLPLPHMFERTINVALIAAGSEINFYRGDILKLKDDLALCKPTYFCAVPRVFNRFYQGLQQFIGSLPEQQREGAEKAIKAKLDFFHQTGKTQHEQLDSMIFNKTKQVVGGRCRIMITGAAPISPDILDFLKIAFCCPIIEGFGQTETSAASFLTDFHDNKSGHVGGPTISQEYKLVDVPDMNYLSTDVIDGVETPRGEICIRGPSQFSGYFDDQERTQETVDKDGFVHTGDIGQIGPGGALKIIDRKKNLFKLQQGEYVSPEKIENIYLRAPGVSEALVLGDSLQMHTVGVIVADPVYLKSKAEQLGIQGTHEELCLNNQLKKIVLENCISQGQREGLNGFEQIKNIYLENKPFMQVGVLTETMKMQRHIAKLKYQQIQNALYAEIQ